MCCYLELSAILTDSKPIYSDKTTAAIFGFQLTKVEGQYIWTNSPAYRAASSDCDKVGLMKPIYWSGISHHPTKDGRYFLTQTFRQAMAHMRLLGIEDQDCTPEEGLKIWQDRVKLWDSRSHGQ